MVFFGKGLCDIVHARINTANSVLEVLMEGEIEDDEVPSVVGCL